MGICGGPIWPGRRLSGEETDCARNAWGAITEGRRRHESRPWKRRPHDSTNMTEPRRSGGGGNRTREWDVFQLGDAARLRTQRIRKSRVTAALPFPPSPLESSGIPPCRGGILEAAGQVPAATDRPDCRLPRCGTQEPLAWSPRMAARSEQTGRRMSATRAASRSEAKRPKAWNSIHHWISRSV
jgi:hypothetical protein